MNLNQAIRQARQLDYDEKLNVPRPHRLSIPPGFEPSPFPGSIALGAQEIYRESKPTDTVHMRVYPDRITLELDRYHPRWYPAKHALSDATAYTVGAATLATALWSAKS